MERSLDPEDKVYRPLATVEKMELIEMMSDIEAERRAQELIDDEAEEL